MRVLARSLMLVSLVGPSPMPPGPEQRPTITGFMNAERLAAHCAADPDSEAAMGDICVGYVAGVADQVTAQQSDLPASKRTICLPRTATIGDIKAAVQAHLAIIDYEPNSPASVIVERSLTIAFPC